MSANEKAKMLAQSVSKLTQAGITTMIADALHSREATFGLIYDMINHNTALMIEQKNLEEIIINRALLKKLQLGETVMVLALGLAAWKGAISLDAVLANMIEHGVDKDDAEKCVVSVRGIAENLKLEQPSAEEVLEKFNQPASPASPC